MTQPMIAILQQFSTSTTLDGSGYGYVRLAPSGRTWDINNMSVRCSTTTLEAICTVYRGLIGPDYRIAGTFSGNSGDNNTDLIHLEDGNAIIVEWTGGDPGCTATVTISGSQSLPTRDNTPIRW